MRYTVVAFFCLLALCLARPAPEERKFVSTTVDKFIEEMKSKIANSKLAEIFENCYPNTLDTTIYSYTVFSLPIL